MAATNDLGVSDAGKQLYSKCQKVAEKDKDGFRRVFNQDELQQLSSDAEDLAALLMIIHELTDNALFISLKHQGKVCWSTRHPDAAAQVRLLNKEERMVYQVIEESHKDGVWIKKIKQKLGIYDHSVEKMVHRFMGLNLIKCIKHVKAPLQKTYMLFHLAPSDEVTGGSFYDAGDLDETMVEELGNVIVLHVRQLSWREIKRKHAKREHDQMAPGATTGSHERTKKRKLDVAQGNAAEDGPRKQRSAKDAFDLEPDTNHIQFAFPVGHRYPTTEEIRKYIDETGLLRTINKSNLAVDEVQQILNVLEWDQKLEVVNGGYRTVRGVREKPMHGWSERWLAEQDLRRKRGNGFTEAPCGRCPVIDLCVQDGPLNAENCEQYDKWLKMF